GRFLERLGETCRLHAPRRHALGRFLERLGETCRFHAPRRHALGRFLERLGETHCRQFRPDALGRVLQRSGEALAGYALGGVHEFLCRIRWGRLLCHLDSNITPTLLFDAYCSVSIRWLSKWLSNPVE